MKKLIFCCLVVLMGACKDKDKEPEPEQDFAPDFAGTYATTTVAPNTVTAFEWVVTNPSKNQLTIAFTKTSEVALGGTKIGLIQSYNLTSAKTTAKDKFELSETVDVDQSNNQPLKQKVEGQGTRVVNAAGVPQINITLKITNEDGALAAEDYLELKKK